MKYLSLLIILISNCARSQYLFQDNAYVNVGIGTTSYLGEMSPYRTFYKGIFKTVSSNFNASAGRNVNEHWGDKIDLTVQNLRGDDFSYGNNNTLLARNLHFKIP